MSIDVDDLVPVSPPQFLVGYQPIKGKEEIALIEALHPTTVGDDHEVRDGRGTRIAICETAEFAALVAEAINERYRAWVKTRNFHQSEVK